MLKTLSLAVLLFLPVSGATLRFVSAYNALAFDTIQYSNTSTETGLAAGTDITLTNMFISVAYPSTNTSLQILSGGSVNLTNGSVNGSIQYETTGTSSATQPSGATFTQAPSPFDFAVARAFYENYSDNLATLAATGTTTAAFGTITLAGSAPGLNIFTLPSSGYGATITNLVLQIPAGATALINVQGTNVTYNYAGFDTSFGSTPASKILWNLPSATTVTTAGTALLGSVVAPRALVDLQSGSLTGQIVADSLTGSSFALRFARFDGEPPGGIPNVPEPSAFALGATGALALLSLRRSRR